MQRVPLLSGTRLAIVNAPDDAVVLRPPPPGEPIQDVGAAVRDALRFPLAGEPLEAMARRGGRATIVVEPPAMPLPGSPDDPRRAALAASVDELVRAGVPMERQTILVAGGLQRRLGRRDVESLVEHAFARRFHGAVEVHDAEDPALIPVGELDGTPLRLNPLLLETDMVVVVTAAETVQHGGPAALLAAGGPEALRASRTASLVETSGSAAWNLAVAVERLLARRVPLIGVSLSLNLPVLGGALRGYPYSAEAVERISSSPLRRGFGILPGPVRARLLRSLPLELSAAAAFGGPPSVAHAEALIRVVEARSAFLDQPLDALCIGIPRATPHLPRERPNPVLASFLGLGLALRLWRDTFPIAEGGTAILLHRFHRAYAHPTQHPYRTFMQATRAGRDADELARAEDAEAQDPRAIASYREGRTCHPRLPFADWAACAPALARLGAVLIAGCRDAAAARQLGFVPTHGIGAALTMAHGRAGGPPRIGFLLSPPYFPVRVGT
jgi:hypothetical protein